MDSEMPLNEIGADILFASDESDTLFINAVQHDPAAIEIIKNFPHMLGNEGEEFIAFASLDAEPVDMDILVYAEEETFDLDQIIATAPSEDAEPPSSLPLEEALPEIAGDNIDLDQLFDVIQISAAPSYTDTTYLETAMPGTTADAAREMALMDSSSLTSSVLDGLDPSAGIDDIFKKLVLADES
ncbi:hypothetical protein [Sneathiella sp.]|uniref:hypothetical protein n=1 Tax=Sneathiella sp. TaxID=1964365 RepID=UPI002610CC71|nr:hypothetical protein [Sneathiella sp.]MDF2368494.1 hypothetical protein [Sneathiella sp.]